MPPETTSGAEGVDLADSAANRRAANRVRAARGSIYAAFDATGCGIDHDQMLEYLAGSPHFMSLPEDQRGKVAGIVMGCCIVAVESERGLRRLGRWFR